MNEEDLRFSFYELKAEWQNKRILKNIKILNEKELMPAYLLLFVIFTTIVRTFIGKDRS